jgi:hypothetical protein
VPATGPNLPTGGVLAVETAGLLTNPARMYFERFVSTPTASALVGDFL